MKAVLHGNASSSFYINAWASKESIFQTTLSLMFTNDLPGVTSSELGIYIDDITIYAYLSSMFHRFDMPKLATSLEKMSSNQGC